MFSFVSRPNANVCYFDRYKTKPTEEDLRAYVKLRENKFISDIMFKDESDDNSNSCCLTSNAKIFSNPFVRRIETKKDRLKAALRPRHGVRYTVFGNTCEINKPVAPVQKKVPCPFINKNKF